MEADIVIVGAGISGFYVATELLRWRRGLRVVLADRYKFLGGRTFTFHGKGGVKWEEGAARVADSHHMLRALCRRHRIGLVPIEGDLTFKAAGRAPEPDNFIAGLSIILGPLRGLPAATLGNSTIRELLEKIHGRAATEEILVRYPYRAELDVMRADLALELFAGEFSSFTGYSVLREGFSELIRRMEREFLAAGGQILRQHELVALGPGGQSLQFAVGPPAEGLARPTAEILCRAAILAIPVAAMAKLREFSGHPLLRQLRMEPLLRVYSIYPKGSPVERLPKMVTPGPNRFVIPNGGNVLQVSYTDSSDAEPLIARLKQDGEAALGRYLTETLEEIVGERLPAPTFTKAHKWAAAVTYWLPGDYSPAAASRAAIRPLPETYPAVFLCGESYSMRQCWVEGALEHAALALRDVKKVMGN
jgi:hypothetical protein